MTTVFQVLHHLQPILANARRVVVAYSGGLDSTVLLHQVTQLGLPTITAIHINHQLSPHSDRWVEHCRTQALQWGCEFQHHTVDVVIDGKGGEDAAREARHQVFMDELGEGEVLLTAHHSNDQAETLLFRLLRGAGLRGLAAVPEQRALVATGISNSTKAVSNVYRPFLSVSRASIEHYALQQGLEWVEDESNVQLDFDRNYIRHEILPKLVQRWPRAPERIAASAALLADSERLLNRYLAEDLQRCSPRRERVGSSLCLEALEGFDWNTQKHLIRYWLVEQGYLLPSQRHMHEVQKLMVAVEGAQPEVSWGPKWPRDRGASVYRYQRRLYLLPRLSLREPSPEPLFWDGESLCSLGHGFELGAEPANHGLIPGSYQLRVRRGGERCRPAGRQHSQSLKKLLQAYGLEPWLRNIVPLIYQQDTLAAVGDLWICEGFAHTGGSRLVWRKN